MIFSGASLMVAIDAVRKGAAAEGMKVIDYVWRGHDPIVVAVMTETKEDFYVRYNTLQLLTALLTNSPNRLQEAVLTIPRGITRLMDMLMDHEVIRNEALLLLTYLST